MIKRIASCEPVSELETAQRVKIARNLTGLSRSEFAKKHDISPSTIRNWESSPGPLTRKGAIKLVTALKKDRVFCTEDWLMHGRGMSPQRFEDISSAIEATPTNTIPNNIGGGQLAVIKAVEWFLQHNQNSTVLAISDDCLSPLYNLGDYVGGIKHYTNFEQCTGCICIVESEKGISTARHFSINSEAKNYILSATNPRTSATQPIVIVENVISVAPITWWCTTKDNLPKT